MQEEEKPAVDAEPKSSLEILSELFSSFDAEPPLIIKKEKDELRKHKKTKKKHKHKDKKRKKKDKKSKQKESDTDRCKVDLAELLIKQERQSPERKIKLDTPEISSENIKGKKSNRSTTNSDAKNENINTKKSESKITIKNFNFNSIFKTTICEVNKQNKKDNVEEGELSSDTSNEDYKAERVKLKRKHTHTHNNKERKKKKHSHSSGKSSKSHKKRDIKKSASEDDYDLGKHNYKEEKHNEKYKDRSRSRDKHQDAYRNNDDYKSKYKHSKSRSRSRSNDDHKHHTHKESFYKQENCRRKEPLSYNREFDEKWFMRDRYRGYSEQDRERERKYRGRSSSGDRIDKKKLLEIARKNAIQMMKSGNLPGALTLGSQAQEKVLAAIKAGGKTIEELTDFCKTLSKKEELGELSSESVDENGDGSDAESKAFHHPFQIKDRPSTIIMNIKNSVPLPTKTAQERTTELRMQFPVSSGSQHRKTENEWVPLSPKHTSKTSSTVVVPQTSVTSPTAILAIEAPPASPAQSPLLSIQPSLSSSESLLLSTQTPALSILPLDSQVFPINSNVSNIDIGFIVSQRLQAMRRLQENPYDIEAIGKMHKSQKEMQTWAESKQQPGQFTGSTGASILSQAELAAGYQAWARKDQLQNAAPVSGGMGMHLLKKMGWNPGEGLGKEKSGTLEPLLLEVKLDKKGLVANEEHKRKQQKGQKNTVKTLEAKHPVSLLGEYSAKKKLGVPLYTLCLESGPDHKKLFLFKVLVNGLEYQPAVASPNKKQAKADAARLCLQHLGLFPP